MRQLFFIWALLSLAACKNNAVQESNTASNKPLLVIELSSGTNSGFTEKTNQIITEKISFLKVWEQAFANSLIKNTAPEVDFDKNIVLLVALGEKTSGGYTIKISDVIDGKKSAVASILKTSPGKGCVTTQAITYPYQLVQIPKPTKEILFLGKEKIIDCKSK